MRILLIMIFFYMTLFSMNIEFSRQFKKSLKPQWLGVNIAINVKKSSESDILDILNRYSKYINGFKELSIKGGKYTITPNINYKNNHSYKDGYSGLINYTISSKNRDDISSFIYKLQSQKKDKDLDISISNIYWFSKDSETKNIYDDLRFSAIEWGLKYNENLSQKLNKQCTIKSIIFNQNNYPTPMLRMSRSIAMDTAPTPSQDLKNFSISPRFTIECK